VRARGGGRGGRGDGVEEPFLAHPVSVVGIVVPATPGYDGGAPSPGVY